MAKRPTAAALQQYREMMLTNPDTFKQKLLQTYEELRSRSETLWIELDLNQSDETMDSKVRDAERERLELTIARIGSRMKAIQAALDEEEEGKKGLYNLNRKQRRDKEKTQRKSRTAKLHELKSPRT